MVDDDYMDWLYSSCVRRGRTWPAQFVVGIITDTNCRRHLNQLRKHKNTLTDNVISEWMLQFLIFCYAVYLLMLGKANACWKGAVLFNKYVLRAVGCFPGPYLANSFNRNTHNAKHYRSQLFRGRETGSPTVMAAVVIAIAHVP